MLIFIFSKLTRLGISQHFLLTKLFSLVWSGLDESIHLEMVINILRKAYANLQSTKQLGALFYG